MVLIPLMVITLCVSGCIAISQALVLLYDGTLEVSRLRVCLALWLPAIIAKRSYSKKSLDISGSIVGYFVGVVLILHSYCHIVAMITFFVTSSAFTKFRRHRKRKFATDFREGEQRNWKQVLSNGGPAMLFAFLALIGQASDALGSERQLLITKEGDFERMLWYDLVMLGSIACAVGDTWSSEVGAAVGSAEPRLIVNSQPVPRGTNGAVSFVGILASVVGGAVVGAAYWLTLLFVTPAHATASGQLVSQWIFVPLCAVCGLVGSTVDSFLGATFQYSGFDIKRQCVVEEPGPSVEHIAGRPWLDNNSVNLLSCLICGLLTPTLAVRICKLVI